MGSYLRKLTLSTALITACSSASAGTVSLAKQIHSLQGIQGVTANQSSNIISYTVAADYNIDDEISFAFSDDVLPNFPNTLTGGVGSLALDSNTDDSVSYKVTSALSVGDTITFGSIFYPASSLLINAFTVTVSSQTETGEALDTAGTRTATIAEAKSQFGNIALSTRFDAVIQNDTGQDSTTFSSDSPTLSWYVLNPNTTGWLNLASATSTQITLEGEAGKMAGLTVANFTAGGTETFSTDSAQLSISNSARFPSLDFPETIRFTAPGNVALTNQSFKMSISYGYWSAAAVQSSIVMALKVNAGAWTLSTPDTTPEPTALLNGSVAFDYQSNTLNGAFCDLDDVLDPGETSMMTVTLTNAGSGLVSGMTAQVTSTADITFTNNGDITFTDIPSARDTASTSLEMTLNTADVDEEIDVVVTFMSDDSGISVPAPITSTLKVNSDYIKNRSTESFDTRDTVWLDWQRSQQVASNEDPEHALSQWEVYNDDNFGMVILGPNLSQENDISLLSPSLVVADTGDFSLNFDHFFEFETGSDLSPWDGGVIEISVNSGDWIDVIEAGARFSTGYNGTIAASNPSLGNRDAFVSRSSGESLATEAITFTEGDLNGHEVQFRFRIGSDASISAQGWIIDNVSFTNMTETTPFSLLVADSGVCVNRQPFLLEVTGTSNIVETNPITLSAQGFDHDAGDTLYVWTQIAGSSPVNSWDRDSSDSSFTFDAPHVTENETYTFSVVASDGERSSAAQNVSVTVINNATPVVTTNQSSVSITEKETVTLTVSGRDTENDSLMYTWTMDGEVLNESGPSYQYTAPKITEDTVIIFNVTATDGNDTSNTVQITVNVANSSSSGGGSMGIWIILLLPLVFFRRKNKP